MGIRTAVRIGSHKTVSQLLDGGGLIETISWDTLRRVLHSKDGVLEVLLQAGLEINRRDENGKSLLLHTDDTEVVNFLLKNKADVNLQDNDGDCALLSAVRKEKHGVAEILLNNGADIDLRNREGESAASILLTKRSSVSAIQLELTCSSSSQGGFAH